MIGWPQGVALAEHAELDSTNQEALRRAAAGEAGPIWITAARQTAGRGRRGRAWSSPEGNLAATLLIRPTRPLAEWAQLSFAAAIATADMAAHFAPGARMAVKWPNDVLGAGAQSAEVFSGSAQDCATMKDFRKLAGILLESASGGLAIGIGVNLAGHPEGTEFPATDLTALGAAAPTPKQALTLLAANFAGWYDLWCARGFAPLREAWLARAAGLGQRIRARLPDRERSGVFEGIDETGALLLNEAEAIAAIAAGEVFFG